MLRRHALPPLASHRVKNPFEILPVKIFAWAVGRRGTRGPSWESQRWEVGSCGPWTGRRTWNFFVKVQQECWTLEPGALRVSHQDSGTTRERAMEMFKGTYNFVKRNRQTILLGATAAGGLYYAYQLNKETTDKKETDEKAPTQDPLM